MKKHILLSAVLLVAGSVLMAQSQPSTATSTPVATINGATVYESDLMSVQGQLLQMRKQEYDLKKRALDGLIDQRLLEAEAARLGVSPAELYKREVDAKVGEPSDGEVEAFYLAQQDRMQRSFSQVKPQMQMALKQARLAQARKAYVSELRRKARIEILLDRPRVRVAQDAARLKGPAKAPVQIVEFSDFECPYCRNVQGTLKDLLEKYDGKVSLGFRDFPLVQIHSKAQLAAEASRCAAEQGKFWEYHDRLFGGAGKLEPADLKEHAKALGLDAAKFDACLDGRKYQQAVEQDSREGRNAGIGGTPAFIINGIVLMGGQSASAFEEIIEDELQPKQARQATQ